MAWHGISSSPIILFFYQHKGKRAFAFTPCPYCQPDWRSGPACRRAHQQRQNASSKQSLMNLNHHVLVVCAARVHGAPPTLSTCIYVHSHRIESISICRPAVPLSFWRPSFSRWLGLSARIWDCAHCLGSRVGESRVGIHIHSHSHSHSRSLWLPSVRRPARRRSAVKWS